MAHFRGWTAVRILLHVAIDVLRLISVAICSHAQLAAENLFLRKQLALYVERQVKPRRADDPCGSPLHDRRSVRLISWLIAQQDREC